jgi:CHU_C Type IX secretion signal domain
LAARLQDGLATLFRVESVSNFKLRISISYIWLFSLALLIGCVTQSVRSNLNTDSNNCKIGRTVGIHVDNDSVYKTGKKFVEMSCYPEFDVMFDSFQIDIYNRFGVLMFSSSDAKKKWVCSDNCDSLIESGTYFSIVNFRVQGDSIIQSFRDQFSVIK